MASVQINQVVINSIASAFQNNMETIIRQLAEQYNFDPADAITQFCDKPPTIDTPTIDTPSISTPISTPIKSNNKIITPEFALPWTNQPIPHCCDALRSYYGVFSQCTNLKHGNSNFCKTCSKKGDAPPCGTIHDRAKHDFIAPNGKKPLHYTIFIKKLAKHNNKFATNWLSLTFRLMMIYLTLLKLDADALKNLLLLLMTPMTILKNLADLKKLPIMNLLLMTLFTV